MCFKRKPVPVITGNNICLSYNLNNYPGNDSDLNGCVNDGNNLEKFLLANYPEFKTTRFIDSEVTTTLFHNTVKNTIVGAKSGDFIIVHYSGHGSYGEDPLELDGYSECLYLYDGPYWDRKFSETLSLIPDGVKVLVILDSCFSFGATSKLHIKRYMKSRFMPMPGIKEGVPIIRRMLKDTNLKHILLSGCQERQTSADAYLQGIGYVGAFTWFLLQGWRREYNYNQWTDETIYRVNREGFEQVPGILGNQTLINQRVLI